MVLSEEGIKRALAAGELEIQPQPARDQYTTSAVDLILGDQFSMWKREMFEVPGARIDLDLDPS